MPSPASTWRSDTWKSRPKPAGRLVWRQVGIAPGTGGPETCTTVTGGKGAGVNVAVTAAVAVACTMPVGVAVALAACDDLAGDPQPDASNMPMTTTIAAVLRLMRCRT